MGLAQRHSAVVVDADRLAGMRALGATDADVAKVQAERCETPAQAPDECEVWPDNWGVFTFFLWAQTQWVYAGGGMGPAARVAMNYPGVESVARIRGVGGEQLQAWADDLGVIELAVLQADTELAARRRKK